MCVFLVARPFCWYWKFWAFDLDFWPSFEKKNLTLALTFELKEIGLILQMCVPCDKPYKKIDLVTLTLTFDLLLKKLNIWHNVLTKRDWAYILKCVYSLWQDLFVGTKKIDPWPWLLTYFWKKNLTLTLTFKLKQIGLSYYAWIFLVARPFCPYQKFCHVTLTSNFGLLLKNKLNLSINFWTERDRAFILYLDRPDSKTFLSVPKFLSHNVDRQLWHTFDQKNLTLNRKRSKKITKVCAGVLVPLGQSWSSCNASTSISMTIILFEIYADPVLSTLML